MEKISIKSYAVKHKLSIYNVVKMIKLGEIATETVLENAKDVVYVLIDKEVENEVKKAIVTDGEKEPHSLKKENARLKKEIEKLKEEITTLKNRVQ